LSPFEVVRRIQGGSYAIQEVDGTPLKGGVAAYHLLPYIYRLDIRTLKRLDEEDSEEVEKILEDPWDSEESSDGNFEDSEEDW